ncbi:MAG: hypothetical protein K0B87_09340, partial [Candidatus Syntrophosphaera sp.]|nr:hypothetical protein [Candidatus Syntrophosphaera sp.]
MYNSTSGVSLKGFFLEESSNQLIVNSTFYPPPVGGTILSYQDPNPQAYYMDNYGGTNPIGYTSWDEGYYRLHLMLTNAVVFVAGSVSPSLNIDADNDGSIDNLSFICMGGPTAWNEALWPHNWVLDSYHLNPLFPSYNSPLVYINGKMADEYDFQLRDVIDPAVIAHEFSHTLGFPELYHYTWDGIDPCGWWDPMDFCQGNPQHHLAYMKWRYGGWFPSIPTLPGPGDYTLTSIDTNPFSCYWLPLSPNEWYVVEYRRQNGLYESTLPGSGLIVYRVRTDLYPWGNAGGPPDEVYVYRLGGSPTSNGFVNAANFGLDIGRTAINMFTDPYPFDSWGGPGNLILHHVSSTGGTTINFTIGASIPNVWVGYVNNAWEIGGNWSKGTVPTAMEEAIITGSNFGMPHPVVSQPGQVCGDLRVETPAHMMINLQINNPGSLVST